MLATAELYDPTTGVWSRTGSSLEGRLEHSATLLPNGKVLAGGNVGSGLTKHAELYDPTTGHWITTGICRQRSVGRARSPNQRDL
jgi:hypothetical protein